MIFSQTRVILQRATVGLLFGFVLAGCIEVTYVDPTETLEDIKATNTAKRSTLPLSNQGTVEQLTAELNGISDSAPRKINIFDKPNLCKRHNEETHKYPLHKKPSHKHYLLDFATDTREVKSRTKNLTALIKITDYYDTSTITSEDDTADTTDTKDTQETDTSDVKNLPEENLVNDSDTETEIKNNENEVETEDENPTVKTEALDENINPQEDEPTPPTEDTFEQPSAPLDALFPDQYFCHNETVLLAESMSVSVLEKLCEELNDIENTFHQRMQTNHQVVDNDKNDLVEIRIFDSYYSYLNKIKSVSGLTYTSSGGFFYEGTASKEGNRAKIYVFEKTFSNGVWNLAHEYIHHLNARYIKFGNVTNKPYYLFWEEGIAEYFSQRPGFSDARFALLSTFTIKDVLAVDEKSSQTAIYGWSYWLIRYLIEQESDLLYQLTYHLQQGEFTAYEELLNQLSEEHNDSFQQWLKNPDV